jgi:pyridinium-3,5-biscarboxylic acid mononucleotide sulfurtransferase
VSDTATPISGTRATDSLEKEAQLAGWLRDRESVLVGYSGGVDSSYLAAIALGALGAPRVLAVIGRSASYPLEQWNTARNVAAQLSLPVLEIDTAELADPRYAANPSNRCYFCKTTLWGRLVPIARERGITTVVDGTNADDVADYRPGAQAAREYGVESPLAIVGLTKAEIRARSRVLGLPTWAQPSSPCLSSRIPYGSPVTAERLRRIEAAERALRELGITGDLRVRDHGDLARIELRREAITYWSAPSRVGRLAGAVRAAGYQHVALDLAGFRSGSLNVLAGVYDG